MLVAKHAECTAICEHHVAVRICGHTPTADRLTRRAQLHMVRTYSGGHSTLAGAANWKTSTSLCCTACLELTRHDCGMTASCDPSRWCLIRTDRITLRMLPSFGVITVVGRKPQQRSNPTSLHASKAVAVRSHCCEAGVEKKFRQSAQQTTHAKRSFGATMTSSIVVISVDDKDVVRIDAAETERRLSIVLISVKSRTALYNSNGAMGGGERDPLACWEILRTLKKHDRQQEVISSIITKVHLHESSTEIIDIDYYHIYI
jgi:hypothetical protein